MVTGKRFGIESSYRLKNLARIKTTTKKPTLRLLFVGISFLIPLDEIYENPHSQVFLCKCQPPLITEEEIEIVRQGMKKYSSAKSSFKIDIKNKIISIFVADQDVEALVKILRPIAASKGKSLNHFLARSVHYSAVFRFILTDEKERLFSAQRYCYLGSIDDWIDIREEVPLSKVVKTCVKHIGKESYYELW